MQAVVVLQRTLLLAFQVALVFSGAFGLFSFYLAVLLGGAFASITVLRSSYRRVVLPDKTYLACYGALAVLSVLSMLWAVDPQWTVPVVRRTVALTVILTGLLWYLSAERDYLFFLRAASRAGALGGLVIALGYIIDPGGRSHLIGGPNAVGVILGNCFLATFLLFHITRERRVLVHAGWIGAGILLTLSVRTLVFVVIVVALFGAFQLGGAFVRGRIATASLRDWAAVLIVLAGLGSGVVMGDALGRIAARGVGGEENVARVAVFVQGMEYAADQPVWGAGFGASRLFFERDWGVPTYTHNTYLELWIGGGLPALALYLLLIGMVMGRAASRVVGGCNAVGQFALAYAVGVLALGWTMDLYINVTAMVMLAFLHRLTSRSPGAVGVDSLIGFARSRIFIVPRSAPVPSGST
jgi:O-antigen ligase